MNGNPILCGNNIVPFTQGHSSVEDNPDFIQDESKSSTEGDDSDYFQDEFTFSGWENLSIQYNEKYIKIILQLDYTRQETLCPFIDKFPFGISECECQLSFSKGKYKSQICDTINQYLRSSGSTKERRIVYVGLGCGALLSDFRAIKLILRNIYKIKDLEIHFIDKIHNLNEFDIYQGAKWVFIMNWLHQFSLNPTVYIHQQLDDYIELCNKEPERKANVITIFDLGYTPSNIQPFNYEILKSGLQKNCIVSYLGFVDNKYYPYYDVCKYEENKFIALKIYDARKDIKVQLRLWWKKLDEYLYYYGLTKGDFILHIIQIGFLAFLTYKVIS